MHATTFQRLSSPHPYEENICEFVTHFYLENHKEAKNVYDKLQGDEEKTEQFQNTFKKAMKVSLEVLTKNHGDFYIASDETDKIQGFSMGMRYLPSVSPLTAEFFAETIRECPVFFEIFSKTMPLVMKYGKITDSDLEKTLNGREVYYLGMTAFRDQEIGTRLAAEIAQQIFAKDKPFSVLYTLSSSGHESQMVQWIASQKMEELNLCLNRVGMNQENPHTYVALIHPFDDPIGKTCVQLYEEAGK